MDQLGAVLVAVVPSIVVGYVFYRIVKAILEADRNERRARAHWEATHADNSSRSSASVDTPESV